MAEIQQLDNAILNYIQTTLHIPLLNQTMPWVSWLDNGGAVWIAIAVLLLFYKKYRSTGLLILIALTICFLLGDLLLKPLVARARPFTLHPAMVLLIPRLTDFSFPSGHTDSSFAAATILLFKKKSWGIPAMALASLIAFSRLYLYVHYPSDIVGGILLGVGAAFLAVWLLKKFNKRNSNGTLPPSLREG